MHRYPFERPSDRNDDRRFQKILQRILKVDYSFPPSVDVSPECKDLLTHILVGALLSPAICSRIRIPTSDTGTCTTEL